jgi:uncharacterized protein
MNKKDLMPFHMFNHDGNCYVINVENMQAFAVDNAIGKAIENIINNPEARISPDMEENLKNLGLASEIKEKKEYQKKHELFTIVNMALLLTQSCNLRCIYCYGNGGEYGTGGSMNEKTAFQSVDWLLEQSGKAKKINIVFFGGEPFLNFSLMKKVVEYAEQKTTELDKIVGFSVTTNATLLDDDKISFIKEHNIHVVISIDGPKKIQDIQRPFADGKGSYDVILPKIKKLLKVLPEACSHAVLLDDKNAHIVKNALREIGFDGITIAPASASLFDKDTSNSEKADRKSDYMLNELEIEANAWLHFIKSRDSKSLKNLMKSSELYECLMAFLNNRKKIHACGAGLKFVAVSCSGDIYLCHRFVGIDNYKLGNVFNKCIDREKYQESPINWIEECTGCFAKYYCAGGCKHDNASSCNSAFKPPKDMCCLRRRETELAAATISMLDNNDRAFLTEYEIFPPKSCLFDF